MAGADGIFSEDQGARVRIPDRKSPVANQQSKAIAPPIFVGCRDNRNIRRANRQNVAQPPDQIRPVVQAAIPSEDGAGCRDVWLCLAPRFLSSVESAIEDADVSL